jgi:hypothetical protein
MNRTIGASTMGILKTGAAVALTLALAGCSNLLEQTAPSRVLADNLTTPTNAKLLVDGARASFGCALQAYLTAGGLMTDEMEDHQLAAAAWDYDRRSNVASLGSIYAEAGCDVGQNFGIYRPIQTARYQADYVLEALRGWTDAEVPDRAELIATAALYSGYGHLILGEGYCTAAIMAPTEALNASGGAELQPEDVFALAETRFSEAITAAAGNATLLNAARVGRARARLDLAKLPGKPVNSAKLAEAGADAAAVTAGFRYTVPYNIQTGFSSNMLGRRMWEWLYYGIAPPFQNVTWNGKPDPRVAVTNTGLKGADRAIVWAADKYPSATTPIPMAHWSEAQLIQAEAAGGQAAVTIIDRLHQLAGLDPSGVNPNDATAVQNQIILERSREMFLEGHHFYDVKRFNLPYDPPVGTPFAKGGTYGDQRCFPLPDIERTTNPKLKTP